MALYAFDGTWNSEKPQAAKDTNVVKFRDAYDGNISFWSGGRAQTEQVLHAAADNFNNGDREIDIVGFGHGAAIAVHFANQLKKAQNPHKTLGGREVRFLGVWDIVSFDPGHELDIPKNVKNCFHAMALDEQQEVFPLTRLARPGYFSADTHLSEIWFRGGHADVGGGNKNVGLSSIALSWMYAAAQRSGMQLKSANLLHALAQQNCTKAISRDNFQLAELSQMIQRKIRSTDIAHVSVSARECCDHNNPPVGLPRMADDGTITASGFI